MRMHILRWIFGEYVCSVCGSRVGSDGRGMHNNILCDWCIAVPNTKLTIKCDEMGSIEDLENRIVYAQDDHGYQYRATIFVDKVTRFRKRVLWKFIIEQYFIGWNHYATRRGFKSQEEVVKAAHSFLNSKESARNRPNRIRDYTINDDDPNSGLPMK